MKRTMLLVPLCLAGCTLFGAGNTPQAECTHEAEADPKVMDLTIQNMNQYAPAGQDLLPEITVAKRQALLRCLRAKGLAPPGGVEPVVRGPPALL
ncbi:MAG: hypothetical protein JO227_01425 [Acetobacteraceae bacterium]|nr:hypothetical protein [Acetobacteraceae bacterium]